jgi:hypothetical protein
VAVGEADRLEAVPFVEPAGKGVGLETPELERRVGRSFGALDGENARAIAAASSAVTGRVEKSPIAAY